MSSTTTGFPEEAQSTPKPDPYRTGYVPTEEEMALIRECNWESFFYRSLPFSMISMGVTQALIARGALTASPRLGSFPKLAFAGFCGYVAGKISYIEACRKKFEKLENFPFRDFVRQRTGMPLQNPQAQQSELSDPDNQSFGAMFQPAEAPGNMSTHNRDYGYGYHPEPPAQMGRASDSNAPAQSYMEEDEPKKKSILYEDLRLKNRVNYEVTLNQKTDSLLGSPADRELDRPKKPVKKNIYGDAWEE